MYVRIYVSMYVYAYFSSHHVLPSMLKATRTTATTVTLIDNNIYQYVA